MWRRVPFLPADSQEPLRRTELGRTGGSDGSSWWRPSYQSPFERSDSQRIGGTTACHQVVGAGSRTGGQRWTATHIPSFDRSFQSRGGDRIRITSIIAECPRCVRGLARKYLVHEPLQPLHWQTGFANRGGNGISNSSNAGRFARHPSCLGREKRYGFAHRTLGASTAQV